MKKTIKRNRDIKKHYLLIFFIFAVPLWLINFFIGTTTVEGQSMSPTLSSGERLIVLKSGLKTVLPNRGDIIVFKAPDKRGNYIKRVIGLPGEFIEILNGDIYINGMKYDEKYLTDGFTRTYNSLNKWQLKKNEYFVLGDNRTEDMSNDSRSFGPINIKLFEARAFFRFWPFNRFEEVK